MVQALADNSGHLQRAHVAGMDIPLALLRSGAAAGTVQLAVSKAGPDAAAAAMLPAGTGGAACCQISTREVRLGTEALAALRELLLRFPVSALAIEPELVAYRGSPAAADLSTGDLGASVAAETYLGAVSALVTAVEASRSTRSYNTLDLVRVEEGGGARLAALCPRGQLVRSRLPRTPSQQPSDVPPAPLHGRRRSR